MIRLAVAALAAATVSVFTFAGVVIAAAHTAASDPSLDDWDFELDWELEDL